jgi:organic radical activating enzyme
MIKGLHIELTNKCTLKCPRCSRTEFIEEFPKQWKNKDIDINQLIKFLDIDLNGVLIRLAGNYGDPIYYNEIIQLIKYLKNKKANICIHTNGSYKSIEWWKELADVLTKDDEIVFAIDGIPENFTQYRINADWKSIKEGIAIMTQSDAHVTWQYILFPYNRGDVSKAQQLSVELGFNKFFTMESDRRDHNLDLINLDEVSKSKVIWKQTSEKNVSEIDPKCSTNDQHFISAEGRYTPCCFSSEHRFYYKTKFYKEKNAYDIKETTLSAVLNYPTTVEFFKTIHIAKPDVCTFSCPKVETDV